jgi:hypothetical protein
MGTGPKTDAQHVLNGAGTGPQSGGPAPKAGSPKSGDRSPKKRGQAPNRGSGSRPFSRAKFVFQSGDTERGQVQSEDRSQAWVDTRNGGRKAETPETGTGPKTGTGHKAGSQTKRGQASKWGRGPKPEQAPKRDAQHALNAAKQSGGRPSSRIHALY